MSDDKQNAVQPVLPVKQARSLAMRERILAAVLELVNKGQYHEATVNQITQKAGCSVGAFYGRFADKTAALFSFYDQRCIELQTALDETFIASTSESLAGLLRKLIRVMVRNTINHLEFLRASQGFFAAGEDNAFKQRAQKLNQWLISRLQAAIAEREDELNHPDSDTAALFTVALIAGLTRDGLLVGQNVSGSNMDLDGFMKELERAVFGYLDLASRS